MQALSSNHPPFSPPPPYSPPQTPPHSYCECYNEEITDLLAPAATGLAIRDGDQHRGVYVEGLSEHVAVNGECVWLRTCVRACVCVWMARAST